MISADEHFNKTLEVTRALAHTQPSGDDDDYQMIDYSGADVIKYSGTEKAHIDGECPDSMTVFTNEKKAIKVMRSDLCTLFAVSGRAQDRSADMAKRLDSLPNLSLIKNIQDGSVGFSDETLKDYGWVEAKESGVGLLAFFAALSPEQRKVLEAENRKKRRSLNPRTGETELVKRRTAHMREVVELKDRETGETYKVPRSTKCGRELVECEDRETGETYTAPRSTKYAREPVEWKDLTLARSAKYGIITSEKKGNWCPCSDKCPSCDIQTSKLWITLRKATKHFVRTGDECGYEVADEDVVAYWCQIAPKLSKEMFQANGANERAVCKTCFYFALKRVSEQLGATSIFVPH
ncbi:unnamed protein product [Bathycoccus prasinos]